MAKKLKPQDLVTFIDQELNLAQSYNNKISNERNQNLKSYYREAYGNEKRGRSAYVSSDVLEAITWAMPQIMKIFSDPGIAKFDAERPEYRESAELATAYAENVLTKQNHGFLTLHNFFHDALLQKNGVVKIYFDNSSNFEREEYTDLTDMELASILNDPAVEPISHDQTQVLDPISQQPIAIKHDLVIKRRINSTGGKIKIENVPVEEVVVSKQARSFDLDEAPFVAHRVKRTISWLRSQGYKVEDDINDGTETSTDYSLEKLTREFQDGTFINNQYEEMPADPSMRLVWVTEAYFRVDYNGDGIAELRKVTKVGNTVLDNEEVYIQPFVSTGPFPQPHKYNSLALADLVRDLQQLKTMLVRVMLDSYAFNVNPSKVIDVTKIIDVNDLLDTNPGNFIRMRGDVGGSFATIPSSGIGDSTFNLLKYVDDVAESRTGVSKMTQGIDENIFNKTATGTQAIMAASQEKLAMIVRIFAETGLAPIYKKIIQLASKFSDSPELIEMKGDYVEVRPYEWKHLKNITVNVGTGSLDKQVELQNVNAIIGLQKELLATQQPELIALIDPEKIHSSLDNLLSTMGYRNTEEFFNRPGSQHYMAMLQYVQQKMTPPPPQPDPNMALVQVENQKVHQDLVLKGASFELDKLKADREFELKKLDMQLRYELELAKLKVKGEIALMDNQLDQISNLNPDESLLTPSEMNLIQQSGIPGQLVQAAAQRHAYEQQMAEEQRTQLKLTEEQMRQQHELKQAEMIRNQEMLLNALNSPKEVVRDEAGNVIGVRPAGA